MTELRTAIAAGDWPRALELAIAAWRASRSVEMADVVDAIASRLPAPPVEPRKPRPTWSEVAATLPDPMRARFAGPVDRKFAWRIGELARLRGDDPRDTQKLVDALADADSEWVSHDHVDFLRLAGDRLVELGDARARGRLERILARPLSRHAWVRSEQAQVVRAVLARLSAVAPDPDAAALLAELTAADTPVDDEPLWREIARVPADDGPRQVLADALIQRGDPRGELISFQLAGTVQGSKRAERMIHAQWSRWLGELACIATRKGTVFRRGMIDEIRLGHLDTPGWAYVELPRHRELCVVRVVRAARPPEALFARFVAGIDHDVEELDVFNADYATALATERPAWPMRVLRCAIAPSNLGIVDGLALFARILPALEEFHFTKDQYTYGAAEIGAAIARLPPLGRVTVMRRAVQDPEHLPPHVEVIDG